MSFLQSLTSIYWLPTRKPLSLARKSLSLLLLCLLLSNMFIACGKPYALSTRLGEFSELLDTPTLTAFQNGELSTVSAYLTNIAASDEAKSARLKELKKREAILLFSATQTADYFYTHFYLPTQNTKK